MAAARAKEVHIPMTLSAGRLKRSRSHNPHVRQLAVSFADYDPRRASSAVCSVNESLIGTRLTMDRRTGRDIHFNWRAIDANRAYPLTQFRRTELDRTNVKCLQYHAEL